MGRIAGLFVTLHASLPQDRFWHHQKVNTMSEKVSGKVGFVSLGCPKALVDSERILTQLRTEGYEVSPSYDDADVVVASRYTQGVSIVN